MAGGNRERRLVKALYFESKAIPKGRTGKKKPQLTEIV